MKIHHFAALANKKHNALRADVMENTSATLFHLSEQPSASSQGLSIEEVQREYLVH
jgi:hypothetical protein